MKDFMLRVKNKGKEYILGLMVQNMMENGEITSYMDL